MSFEQIEKNKENKSFIENPFEIDSSLFPDDSFEKENDDEELIDIEIEEIETDNIEDLEEEIISISEKENLSQILETELSKTITELGELIKKKNYLKEDIELAVNILREDFLKNSLERLIKKDNIFESILKDEIIEYIQLEVAKQTKIALENTIDNISKHLEETLNEFIENELKQEIKRNISIKEILLNRIKKSLNKAINFN